MAKLAAADAMGTQVQACSEVLRSGGLAAVPMETVYGVLARLDRPDSVERLRTLRPTQTPPARRAMTLHIASGDAALNYIGPPTELGRRMLRKLLPGPVALVFSVPEPRQVEVCKKTGIHREDLYDDSALTLRCPAHPATREIIRLTGAPLAATVPGPHAARVEDFADEIRDRVDMILDDGPATLGKPSTIIRVGASDFDIVRPGVYDRRIIEKMLQTTILFVCSGNTCRSPMAEAITRQLLAQDLNVKESQLEKSGFTVTSAGASAFAGGKASPNAVEAVKALGGDLSRHRSKPLTEQLIHNADVIFTMGRTHADVVRMLVPSAASKTMTLDPKGDIEDPIGGELQLYRSLAEKMKQVIEQRLRDQSLFGAEKSK